MTQGEISKLFKKIKQSYSSFYIPDHVDQLKEMIQEWNEILKDVSFEKAVENFREYASDPNHKFPPHPGILAKNNDQKKYAEFMRTMGEQASQHLHHIQKQAVPISEEQRRKVRELFE